MLGHIASNGRFRSKIADFFRHKLLARILPYDPTSPLIRSMYFVAALSNAPLTWAGSGETVNSLRFVRGSDTKIMMSPTIGVRSTENKQIPPKAHLSVLPEGTHEEAENA